MKKAVEEGTVMEKKIPELLIDCKNAVAMTDIDKEIGRAHV